MRIAILGATSQIAKDLVLSLSAYSTHELMLYARRPEVVSQWLADINASGRHAVADFSAFTPDERFDAVINFVGVGNPAQAAAMGASIFDITLQYDQLALDYLCRHPQCRYLFLSSGAAYGSSFDEPAGQNAIAEIDINHLQPQDWYGIAKLHAEARHRSQSQLPIVDIRVFNYFSRTQDLSARFLITDIVRAIHDKTVLQTSSDYIVRDYLHPSDFYQLVSALLASSATNTVVDCYSLAPIEKSALLAAMRENFGLTYETTAAPVSINATGSKAHYYSRSKRAADFGYQPRLTSLEGVLQEAAALLKPA
jgi:nucleoside-diphosphate-sugar epimerase